MKCNFQTKKKANLTIDTKNLEKREDAVQALSSCGDKCSDTGPCRKRNRRKAQEIDRKFICQVAGCYKKYGSEGSLNQHKRIKHLGSLGILNPAMNAYHGDFSDTGVGWIPIAPNNEAPKGYPVIPPYYTVGGMQSKDRISNPGKTQKDELEYVPSSFPARFYPSRNAYLSNNNQLGLSKSLNDNYGPTRKAKKSKKKNRRLSPGHMEMASMKIGTPKQMYNIALDPLAGVPMDDFMPTANNNLQDSPQFTEPQDLVGVCADSDSLQSFSSDENELKNDCSVLFDLQDNLNRLNPNFSMDNNLFATNQGASNIGWGTQIPFSTVSSDPLDDLLEEAVDYGDEPILSYSDDSPPASIMNIPGVEDTFMSCFLETQQENSSMQKMPKMKSLPPHVAQLDSRDSQVNISTTKIKKEPKYANELLPNAKRSKKNFRVSRKKPKPPMPGNLTRADVKLFERALQIANKKKPRSSNLTTTSTILSNQNQHE